HRRPTTIDLDTFLHDMFEEKIAEKEAIKLLSQAAEETASTATSPSVASLAEAETSAGDAIGEPPPVGGDAPTPLSETTGATDRLARFREGTWKHTFEAIGRWARGGGRNLLLATLVFVGAIAGGVGIYHLARSAGTTRWVVRTGVADVAVLLDGKQIATTDETGIARIEGLVPPSGGELHFVHPCYETATLYLPGGGEKGGTRDVQLAPRMAQLDIYTDPPGAEVIFDGKTQTSTDAFGDLVPARTPLRLSSIQACVPHEIEIHKKGFVPWKKSFVLSAGEETAITVELERSKELGEMGGVLLSSIPEGCRIFIDGQPLEQKTPAEIRLPGGQTYEIVLRKEGFEEWKTQIPIEAGRVRKFLARLEEAYGFVAFDIDPPVDVFLDGKIHRRPSPKTFFKVPVGEHDVTFSRRDLGIHRTERIRIEENRYRTVRRRFPAFLSVRVKSGEAVDVYLDDRFLGTTPIVDKEISHGRHEFRFVSQLDRAKRKKLLFTSRAGKHYEVVIDLLEAGIVAQIEKKPAGK
ncbi:MAG: PEGA domain-containing protein, partial [Deltaproteobacteria bacterium]